MLSTDIHVIHWGTFYACTYLYTCVWWCVSLLLVFNCVGKHINAHKRLSQHRKLVIQESNTWSRRYWLMNTSQMRVFRMRVKTRRSVGRIWTMHCNCVATITVALVHCRHLRTAVPIAQQRSRIPQNSENLRFWLFDVQVSLREVPWVGLKGAPAWRVGELQPPLGVAIPHNTRSFFDV